MWNYTWICVLKLSSWKTQLLWPFTGEESSLSCWQFMIHQAPWNTSVSFIGILPLPAVKLAFDYSVEQERLKAQQEMKLASVSRIIIFVLVIHSDWVEVQPFLVSLISENIPNTVWFLLLFLHFRKSFLWNKNLCEDMLHVQLHLWEQRKDAQFIVCLIKHLSTNWNFIEVIRHFSLVISKYSLIMDVILKLWKVERLPTVSRGFLFWFLTGQSLMFKATSITGTYLSVVKQHWIILPVSSYSFSAKHVCRHLPIK